MNLKFRGQTLFAHLKGVPLKVIFEKVNWETGARFDGDESFFEDVISAQSTDLSLDEREVHPNLSFAATC